MIRDNNEIFFKIKDLFRTSREDLQNKVIETQYQLIIDEIKEQIKSIKNNKQNSLHLIFEFLSGLNEEL